MGNAAGKFFPRPFRLGCWILLGFGLVLITPVFLFWYPVLRAEWKMRRPAVYKPVAETLARYCQSDPALFPSTLDEPWLPKEAALVNSGWGGVSPDRAGIQFGGGFYHFGYKLERDPAASKPGANAWNMYAQGEGKPDMLLYSFTLAPSEKVNADELLARATAGYDAWLAKNPDDDNRMQESVEAFLRAGKIDGARQRCRDLAARMPAYYWVVLVNALLDVDEKSFAEGEKRIGDWAKKNPNFFGYLDLAYFHHLAGEPADAEAAIMEAVKYDANLAWGHGTNSDSRGYTAGYLALQSGRPGAAVAMADHMAAVTINGSYAKGAFRALKDAALKAEAGRPETLALDSHVGLYDPFARLDSAKLFNRRIAAAAVAIKAHNEQRYGSPTSSTTPHQ